MLADCREVGGRRKGLRGRDKVVVDVDGGADASVTVGSTEYSRSEAAVLGLNREGRAAVRGGLLRLGNAVGGFMGVGSGLPPKSR